MDNINEIFGRRLRSIRISQNISQEKLAELSNLHYTYIGQIERGEKSPTLESVYKLSCGLGVNVDRLFNNLVEGNEGEKEIDYAIRAYNEMLSLTNENKKKLYNIICEIIKM